MHLLNVVKPTHICNLDCKYCFNDDVRDPVMRDPVLERMIEQTFAYVHSRSSFSGVDFLWHGGEPMVPGIKFYEKVLKLQEAHARNTRVNHMIQTNGVLMNVEWAQFFKNNGFQVSISIDGPQRLHDRFRVDKRGRGSYDRVMRGINIARDAGLEVGVILVISRSNVDYADEIFDLLTSEKLPFNIVPLNRSGNARENYDDVGLAAEEYGPAWIKLYDRWMAQTPENYVYVMDFALRTRAIIYGHAAECVGMSRCANTNISTDPVGDVYACGTLSGHLDTKYGNIMAQTLEELMVSDIAKIYRNRTIDEQCASCKWQHVCHGGCPARSYKYFGDPNKRDYYCPSLYQIFEHIEGSLRQRGVEPGARHPLHMSDGMPMELLPGDQVRALGV